jgi:hypothetical protein
MAGPELKIQGVTFETLRAAITDLYFRHEGMTQEEFDAAKEYVVPMQHNFENPIDPGGQDTWIQYWIEEDDRLTQDFNLQNHNSTLKVARCTLRFLGRRAEVWSRCYHHLTKRRQYANIMLAYCNARALEYVSPIVVRNIDYFGVGNTTKAFTLSFRLQYDEVIDYTSGSGGDRLEYISFAAGGLTDGAVTVEGGVIE